MSNPLWDIELLSWKMGVGLASPVSSPPSDGRFAG